MSNKDLDKVIREFLLSEGQASTPSVRSRFLALEDLLSRVTGRTLSEIRRLEIISEQLKGLKKEVRKLEEQNSLLEEENKKLTEKVSLLENNTEEGKVE